MITTNKCILCTSSISTQVGNIRKFAFFIQHKRVCNCLKMPLLIKLIGGVINFSLSDGHPHGYEVVSNDSGRKQPECGHQAGRSGGNPGQLLP